MGRFALSFESPAATSGANALATAPRLPVAPGDDRTGTGFFSFFGNLGADVADLVGGVAGLVGTAASEIFTQPTNVLKEWGTLGFADTPVRVFTPSFVPALGEAFIGDIKDRYLEGDIAQELYDHPLSFLLDATAIAGAAGAGARIAAGQGAVYGRIGRALMPEAAGKNADLLNLAREARVARASEGIEVLADTVRRFDELPQATRRKAEWLDRLITEPMRVADPTSGYTFNVNPTRNPLIRAVWSDKLRRKYFLESVPNFERQVDELRAVGDDLDVFGQRKLANMEAALDRMKVGQPSKGIGPAQYVAGKKYGTFLASHALKRGAQKVISDLKMRGILARDQSFAELETLLTKSGVSSEVIGDMHLRLEGLDEGRIAALDRDVLDQQLAAKGFASVEEAAEAMIHRTEGAPRAVEEAAEGATMAPPRTGPSHEVLSTDERNTLTAMMRDGQIAWEGLWRYTPDADLVGLPERARFEGELRGALDQTGMPRHQQDLAMLVHDAVSRQAATESFGGDVNAYYATKRAEFAESWQQGVRKELFQRTKKVLRGVVRQRNGKDYLDVKRLAKFAEDHSPDERTWYANARGFIADITRGGRFRLPDGRIVRDSELLADLLAATSIGALPQQQLPSALQIYMMIKDGTYESNVMRNVNGRAVEILNPMDEGPYGLTFGRVGPNVARMVDEIAQGHLVRDWEDEIARNGNDMNLDDLLDLTDRAAPLELNDRQKVRAYAGRLKGVRPDDIATVDRRVAMFFGVFTGQAVWEAVMGEIRPSGRGVDIAKQVTGARYRKLSGYLTEVRDYMNANLPPDELPYQLEEVQSILWSHTRDFLEDEAVRVKKLIRRKKKDTTERLDLERYLEFVTASTTERMDNAGYAQAWAKLKESRYGQRIASNLSRFLDDPRELAQKIQADIKGSTIFGPNFSKLVRFYKTGDFTTVMHELGHEIRATLPDQMSDQLHGIYFTRAHGVSEPAEVFGELEPEELFQVGDRLPVELDQETAGKANEIAFLGPDGQRYEQADGWVPRDAGYQKKWQRVYRGPDGKLYEHDTSGPGPTGSQMIELDPADVLTHEQAWEQELRNIEAKDPQARRVLDVARSTGGAPMRIRPGTVFETVNENDTHYLVRMAIPSTGDDIGKFDWYAVPREGDDVAQFTFLGSGKGRPTSEIRLRLPEATKWRKYGTAGVAKKLETIPSRVGDGYAQVRRSDGELLTEGQWVMVKGTPARIAKLSESPRKKQAVYTATVEVLGGELRMTDGGVKPSTRVIPIDDLEVRGDLAAANYGLSEPIGFTEKGQIGTNYGRWNDVEVGDRVRVENELEQIEEIRAVPYIENGQLKKLNVAVSTRPVRRREVPDYKNPKNVAVVFDKYSQPAWHRGDEVVPEGEPEVQPPPDLPDPNAERGAGAAGLERVIAGRSEVVAPAEVPDEAMSLMEEWARPTGTDPITMQSPLVKEAIAEGIVFADEAYILADQPVGTRVGLLGQPSERARIGVVVEMDPHKLKFGNEIVRHKAEALAEETGEWRQLPIAFKHKGQWILLEGTHRVWKSRQLGREKVKVAAFDGKVLLKDAVAGPARDVSEADTMLAAYQPVKARGKNAPKGGPKEHAWLQARTPEALAGVARMGKPHPGLPDPDAVHAHLRLFEQNQRNVTEANAAIAEHLTVEHEIPGEYVEAVGGIGPYEDVHSMTHGFEDRHDALGKRIEHRLEQEDVEAELEEYDELGEEVVPGEQAVGPTKTLKQVSQEWNGREIDTPEGRGKVEGVWGGDDGAYSVMVNVPGVKQKVSVEVERWAPSKFGSDEGILTVRDVTPEERAAFRPVRYFDEEGHRIAPEARDVQAESRLTDEAEAAAQDEFAARMQAEADALEERQAAEAAGLPAVGREAELREEDLIYQGIDNPPETPEQVGAPVEGAVGGEPAVATAAAAAGEPPPPRNGGPPPGPPARQPWTREMEEAFAEDLERWFYGKIDPPDKRALGAFRVVADGLVQMWRRVRGFVREHELVPEEAAAVFDGYLGKMFADIDSPVPTPITRAPRRMRELPVGDLKERYPDGKDVRQPTVTYLDEADGTEKRRRMNVEEMRRAAVGAAANLQRQLRPIFGKRITVGRKDVRKLRRAHQDGRRVLDASRARITVDNWQGVDRAVDELAANVEVVGVDDSRRLPGQGGARSVRAYVRDESGLISEVEVGTSLWGELRDSTYAHDTMLTNVANEIHQLEQKLARLGQSSDPRALASIEDAEKSLEFARARFTALDRMQQGTWEMIADEIAQTYGQATPGGAERRLMQRMRLWVMRNLETRYIEDGGYDPIYAFERQFLPLRIKSGAEWHEGERISDGNWYGGDSAYKIDDERASAGLPQPTYFPHMESPGSATDLAMTSTIQQRGHGHKKMSENKNYRRNRGLLFEQGTYITDVRQAYSLRAARGIKMRDTYELVARFARDFGRAIADPKDLIEGEVVFAPEFLQAFVKTSIGIEDRMGALLSKMDDSELVSSVLELDAKTGAEMATDIVADGIRSALSVDEREAGALYRAVSEAIPKVQKQLLMVTKQGLELYALPKHVAQQLYEASKYTFGPGVRVFWDKPTAFWRAITLYGGTRWVLNNIFGNTAFAAIGGVRLREIIHAAVDKDYRWYVKQLAEEGGPDVDIGFGTTVDYPVNLGAAGDTMAGRAEQALEGKFRDARWTKPFRLWKDFIRGMNTHVENHYRELGFVEGLRKADAKRNLTEASRSFWGSKADMERMLRDGIDPGTAADALDEMNNWFGDYQTMTPFERGVMRRFIFPFWGFYRHMLKMMVKLPFDHPGKAKVMYGMSLMGQDLREEYGPVPTWMDSMVPFGPMTPGGKQTFLSTAGPNPFNVFMDTGLGLFHPIAKAIYEQATGRDAYTGREFSDPDVFQPFGSQDRYRIIRGEGGVPIDAVPVDKVVPNLGVSLLSQFPQYDIAKQVLAGGRTYDTSGLVESIGNPITDESGQPIAPYGLGTAAQRLGAVSTYEYDIAAYRERLARERENALMQAYERWTEQNVGSAVGVG